MTYEVSLWSKAKQNDIMALSQTTENKALMQIISLKTRNNRQHIGNCIVTRHFYQTAEFMYKYHNHYLPSAFSGYHTQVTEITPYYLRSYANFRPSFARTNTRKFFIKIVDPMIWNRLPLSIWNVASLSLFKSKLHSFLTDTLGTDLKLWVLRYGNDRENNNKSSNCSVGNS